MEKTKTDISYELTPKQTIAFDYLTNDEKLALCFGGAKGGGKSFLFCIWGYNWAKKLIEYFKIPDDIENPLPIGFMGRKRSVDFTKTTFETWKKVIPYQNYVVKNQEKEIVIAGKVKIFFGGLDDQENINKFNSAELAFFAIDQAEETSRQDVGVIQASLRLTYNGIVPPYKELYTANPAECWLKNDFVNGKRKDGIYIPALYSENPYLPDNYLDTLETAFSFDPVLLKAYRDGDWDLLQNESLMITPKMLDNLNGVELFIPYTKRIISCDPSRGGDECVIMVFENTKIVEMKIMHERDTRIIEDELMNLGSRWGTKNFVIDCIGNDIADGLQRKQQNVIRVNSAEKSIFPDKYYNKRAEVWGWTADVILARQAYPIEDQETIRQLTTCPYRIVNGRVQITPKETIKKLLGRSPDRADCYVYGIWGLGKVSANEEAERIVTYRPRNRKLKPLTTNPHIVRR